MPRILVAGFCSFPGPDRAGVQLRHVIRALLRNHQVDVLTVRRGDQAYVERWSGARLLRVPVADGPFRVRVEAFRRAVRRQLEGADYHAIHVRDGFAGEVALEQAARLKLAVVYDATRAPLSQPGALDAEAAAVSDAVETELVRRADLVLVGTEPARRALAAAGGSERVHLVPPGVDVDAFDWEEAPPGRLRVLHVGALEPGRGVRVLVRAMLDVVSKVDAELVLAGPAAPGFADGLRAAIHDLGLADRVSLVGEVSHAGIPALIAGAQVCVAPGAVDVGALPTALFPTKLLEFMACQRAVVAPRRSTVTSLIRDEHTGLLFEPGQPLDLAAAIVRLLTDGDLRANLARAGYDLVRQRHTASGTRREVRKAYAFLAARPAFRDRFAEVLEELTVDAPDPSTGDASDGHELRPVARGAAPRTISVFDDGLPIDEDEGGPIDTGLNEGFGEVTKVEAPSVVGFSAGGEDERPPSYQRLGTAVDAALGDDWVLEDSRIREQLREPPLILDPARQAADAALLRGDGKAAAIGRPSERTPGPHATFVSGELEVPSPLSTVPAELEQPFVAMAPPLGFVADGESGDTELWTRTSAPAETIEPPVDAVPPSDRSRG